MQTIFGPSLIGNNSGERLRCGLNRSDQRLRLARKIQVDPVFLFPPNVIQDLSFLAISGRGDYVKQFSILAINQHLRLIL